MELVDIILDYVYIYSLCVVGVYVVRDVLELLSCLTELVSIEHEYDKGCDILRIVFDGIYGYNNR